jgi:hypothetical protein
MFEKEIILKEPLAAPYLFQCSVELAHPCFGFPQAQIEAACGFSADRIKPQCAFTLKTNATNGLVG